MNPSHVHLLLNHIPVLSSIFGLALLAYALAVRHDAYQRLALVVLACSALAAIPAYLTGEPAEHFAATVAPIPEEFVEPHEEAALVSLVLVEMVGLTAMAALWSARRKPTANRALVWVSLVLALASAATLTWTANVGGRIRHPEIRSGPADSGSCP